MNLLAYLILAACLLVVSVSDALHNNDAQLNPGCKSFGHVCLGAHGKRSSPPDELSVRYDELDLTGRPPDTLEQERQEPVPEVNRISPRFDYGDEDYDSN